MIFHSKISVSTIIRTSTLHCIRCTRSRSLLSGRIRALHSELFPARNFTSIDRECELGQNWDIRNYSIKRQRGKRRVFVCSQKSSIRSTEERRKQHQIELFLSFLSFTHKTTRVFSLARRSRDFLSFSNFTIVKKMYTRTHTSSEKSPSRSWESCRDPVWIWEWKENHVARHVGNI